MSQMSDPAADRFASASTKRIGDFQHLKEWVSLIIGRILEFGPTDRQSCLELREKIEANIFNLVVVGQFKRGKTCMINALLGADILPVSVVPLTSIVTVLKYGEELAVKVFFDNGSVRDLPPAELPDYVTESGNPRNVKEVREVVVLYPSPYLKDGVRLVDTPGVGSVYVHNTDVAYRYLPKSDAALFLLSVDQPVSSAEIEFLSDVREYADRIFFLLNKIDYLSGQEVERALSFSRAALEEVMGPGIKIFPISARTALKGKLDESSEELLASGLPAFSEVLDRFLLNEKGKVLLGSVARNLLKILSRARLEAGLELKSLQLPVEEIREKIQAIQVKRTELNEERRNFDTLFGAEIERQIVAELDRGLKELKGRLVAEMEEGFDKFRNENRELSLKELNEALDSFVRDKIQEEYSAWQAAADEKISGVFDGVCRQFAGRVNAVIDSLLQFSSQLFSVPFEPVEAETLWSTESSFHYKLRDDAVGLDLLTDSLTQVVPLYIRGKWFRRLREWAVDTANRIILSKRKRHMLEAIEMQAGRLRADFLQRLGRSASGFRGAITEKMETVSAGIAGAVERGMELRLKGESESAKMAEILNERVSSMDRIRDELLHVRESIDKL
ncbi:MAG: dynamin family protein [Desulfobacteraceae bacterium]|nr:dynamin family protein [Desulfobacteraceae bacterium]